ncbi:MAG: hypothetical protein COB53_02940 [Elusimicrobia bacterium]|nr:MAG: hypothetical protein COB53_02940 [Elusimicrobiota bacterium]
MNPPAGAAKAMILWITTVFFLMVAVAVHAEPSSPKEIRAARRFRSNSTADRLFSMPRMLLDLPWIPVRKFLNYSERTDLFTRVSDLFYFDEAKTVGWSPKFSSGESSGGGLSLFHHDLFSKKHQADVSFLYSAEDEFFGRAAYAVEDTPASPYFMKVELDLIRDKDVEIYSRANNSGEPVFGAKTAESNRRSYAFTRFSGKLTAGKQINKTLSLAVYVRGDRSKAGQGASGFLSLPSGVHVLDSSIGLFGGGTQLIWDLRDNPLRPSHGTLMTLQAGAVTSPNGAINGHRFGYTQYSQVTEHYFPVFDPGRTFVIRHTLKKIDPLRGRKIPFYDLPRLDENNLLRSFKRNRFQDRGAFSFNLEYRYPIWVTWDAFLFFDGGQTFTEYSDLHAPDFRYSEGLGVRFLSEEKLMFVAQYAQGKEGGRFQVNLGQAF